MGEAFDDKEGDEEEHAPPDGAQGQSLPPGLGDFGDRLEDAAAIRIRVEKEFGELAGEIPSDLDPEAEADPGGEASKN